MRWYTSDLHAGHSNIIGYCARPFPDVEAMNAAIFSRWEATVDGSDEVWVLGDVVLGPKWRQHLNTIAVLPGRKTLVAGNHDKCWIGHGDKSLRYLDDYRVAFENILTGPVAIDVDGIACLASHFPYVDEERGTQDKYVAHRPVDNGLPLVCGHVHEKWRRRGCMVNVGVDQWSFTPVSEKTIAALLRAV
jgi:calcineurin-like phosphoesterase family protein